MSLADLTAEAFSPHLQSRFALSAPGTAVDLVLAEVTKLGSRDGGRDPFSLIFIGPGKPVLPQAIYALDHSRLGPLEIFLVPIGPRDGGMRYEAIFT